MVLTCSGICDVGAHILTRPAVDQLKPHPLPPVKESGRAMTARRQLNLGTVSLSSSVQIPRRQEQDAVRALCVWTERVRRRETRDIPLVRAQRLRCRNFNEERRDCRKIARPMKYRNTARLRVCTGTGVK